MNAQNQRQQQPPLQLFPQSINGLNQSLQNNISYEAKINQDISYYIGDMKQQQMQFNSPSEISVEYSKANANVLAPFPNTNSNSLTTLNIDQDYAAEQTQAFETLFPDQAVNSVYSSMKLLENKYIDLANFYKQLLSKEQELTSKLLSKLAKASQNQSAQKQKKVENGRKETLKKQETAIKENAIIRDLIQVKNSLESQMLDLCKVVSYNEQKVHSPNITIQEQQQNGINNTGQEFLLAALQETLEELERAEESSLHILNMKQYDMFDSATKNQVPTALRNEYLGHWYDAKTTVTQNLADIKKSLTLRRQMAEIQCKLQENSGELFGQQKEGRVHKNQNLPPQQLAEVESETTRQLNRMMTEFIKFKHVVEPQAKKLKTIMLALKVKDQDCKVSLNKAKSILNGLASCVENQSSTRGAHSRAQKSSLSPIMLDGSRNKRARSPFENCMTTQQKQLNLMNRSTPNVRADSRSKNMISGGALTEQNHQRNQGQARRPVTAMTAPNSHGVYDKNAFYSDHNAAVQHMGDGYPNLNAIREILEKYLPAFDASLNSQRNKDRFDNELFKQLDLHLDEQLMYIGQADKILDSQVVYEGANALQELRDLVNKEKKTFDIQALASPQNKDQSYYDQDYSATESNQNLKLILQERPVGELQPDSSEVEISDFGNNQNQPMTQVNKVRSQQVQDLQDSNEQLFSELRKANEKYLDVRVENNKLKDQIQSLKLSIDQLKAKENPQSRQRALSTSVGATNFNPAKSKTENTLIQQKVEAEQRQKHESLKNDTQYVCSMVKTFMTAMRALQKAVSRKQPDMQTQKHAFDSAKRQLEETVQQTLKKLSDDKQMLQPAEQKNSRKPLIAKTQSSSNMRVNEPASGYTKSNTMGHQAISRPSSSNNFGARRGSSSRSLRAEEDLNSSMLQKQVKSLQMEKEKMKELIEELKQTNQLYTSERELFDEKLKTKTTQLHKFASQCQINALKISMLEQVLEDYKRSLFDLSANPQIQKILTSAAGTNSLLQVKNSLQTREDNLKVKLEEEITKIFVNLKVDPQFIALRDELTSRVQLKQNLLDQQFEQLTFRVAEKEEEIQRLKLLLVEKLRELETSIVEISNEVVETDKVTQGVNAKHKQEIQTLLEQKPTNAGQQSNLDRSMKVILSNYDNDEKSRQMEELIQANHELLEQNEKLKQEIDEAEEKSNQHQEPAVLDGDKMHAEIVIELNDQIDEVKQECEKLKGELKLANAGEALYKKEIQNLKYENKRKEMDLKDARERFDKTKLEYKMQFETLKQTTVAMKQQLQKEYNARTTNETKYLAAAKQLKIARQENAELQTEMLILIKRLEDMQQEQAYLNELRHEEGEDGAAEDSAEGTETAKKDEEEERELEQRIAEDPSDAARFYHKLANLSKVEFKSMQKKQSQMLDSSSNERENLNQKLQELESQKKELTDSAIKASKGTKLVICLQNYVRRMLQEKLEESARQIESLDRQTQATRAEADEYRTKAVKLEQDYQTTIQGHDAQMEDLEKNITTVRQQLEEAEKAKKTSREEARLAREKELKIAEELEQAKSPERQPKQQNETQIREQVTQELEEKHKLQQQEMIQTYKRAQRQTNEKNQVAIQALEAQLITLKSTKNTEENDQTAQLIDQLKSQLQSEHGAALQKVEEENRAKVDKANKTTRLMMCLQNRVREMVYQKLEQANIQLKQKDNEFMSLKEDLQDVTESHNLKVIQLRETFEHQKQEETAALIAKYDAQMLEFEDKIKQEASQSAIQNEQEKMCSIIEKLEQNKKTEMYKEIDSCQAKMRSEHELEIQRNMKATKIMICMQNFVRNLIKDRMEAREQELQLEIVQVKESAQAACQQLKSSQDDFEKYRNKKSKEQDEIESFKNDSEKKTGQIDACEAQLISLKSVQEALEREKDDLLIQNEQQEEEMHRLKAELLEVRGSLEFKEMRIEELEEQIEQQQDLGLNRTSELGLGSSGKIIHQGDDLRSLEVGSDGIIDHPDNSSFGAVAGGEGGNLSARFNQDALTIDVLTQENAELREQVEKLRSEQEANAAGADGGRNSWDGAASMGRGSWGSDQMRSNSREVEEHLKHVRSIMTQFLTKLPISAKENEDILTIVYSMLNFPAEEIVQINEQRAKLQSDKPAKKGRMFGGFINKKN